MCGMLYQDAQASLPPALSRWHHGRVTAAPRTVDKRHCLADQLLVSGGQKAKQTLRARESTLQASLLETCFTSATLPPTWA